MQTFANWLTQPTFKHAAAILTPSSTTFELFATFPRGRAKSLIFGRNKSLIHTHLSAPHFTT
jgi:hypothetical protein